MISNKFKNNSAGITLVEVLVSIALFTVIMLAVTVFQRDTIMFQATISNSLGGSNDARTILKVMGHELRSMSASNNGSYPIVSASTSTVTFFSDVDDDGLKEQIRYFISNNMIKRGSIKPTGPTFIYLPANETFSTLAINVKNSDSSPLFEYYDNSYDGTSAPLPQPLVLNDVRLIRINILIEADPNRSPQPLLYTSQITLRNLKDNL